MNLHAARELLRQRVGFLPVWAWMAIGFGALAQFGNLFGQTKGKST